jgi:hypothetical protein
LRTNVVVLYGRFCKHGARDLTRHHREHAQRQQRRHGLSLLGVLSIFSFFVVFSPFSWRQVFVFVIAGVKRLRRRRAEHAGNRGLQVWGGTLASIRNAANKMRI